MPENWNVWSIGIGEMSFVVEEDVPKQQALLGAGQVPDA